MKRLRFRFPWRRARDIRADVDAELRFHLEARADELARAGLHASAARAQAEREFGDVSDARHYMNAIDRDTEAGRRRRDYVDDLRQDIAYAFRMLRGSPAFAIAAIATLALGIGANTAIFSVVDGVLLKPLPFPQPEQLVKVWLRDPKTGDRRSWVSPLDVDDWRAQRAVFTDLGGYFYMDGLSGIDLTGGGEPERLSATFVSPGFFATMGVAPAVGRVPRDDEAVRGGPDKVVVLSNGLWLRRFGGSKSAVDSTITLDGAPYHVLGVMPPGFLFPDPGSQAWIPFSTIPDDAIPRVRGVAVMSVVGRLKPGTPEAQGAAEMNVVTARLAREYPDADGTWGGAVVAPLRDAMTGAVRKSLYVLLGAVVFLMLMACVNVASLLLARASSREREIAVRIALGAGRGRVVRQMLTESLVLALIGGIVGVVIARLGLSALLALAAGQLPRGESVGLDVTVLAFAIGLSVVTGVLFGAVPALRATAPRIHGALREGGRGSVGAGGNRLRSGLVVAQVALAAILMVGAGLMTRSFMRLLDVNLGFDPHDRVAVMFTINTSRHPQDQLYYHQVLDKVRTVPGVIEAGAVRDAPFRGGGENVSFHLPGVVERAGDRAPTADLMFISDGYLHTIGAPLIAGREFTPDDRAGESRPIVVNETFARKYLMSEREVGSEIDVGSFKLRVIGVVADIHQLSVDAAVEPTLYADNMINLRVKTTVIARTAGDPLVVARGIRDAIWSVDRDQPIAATFTLDDAASDAVARPRLLTVLLGIFGVLGLTLGGIGIYGVLAYIVGQRQREIGVRLALGAGPGSVSRMIVSRGMALAGTGIVIGVFGALALGRFLKSVLFGIKPGDPATLVATVAVLAGAAALASWLPARRAAGVDPVAALRGGD